MSVEGVHGLTAAQLRVLSNPLREELLGLVCREALSASRLKERIENPPGNLHYHLERLRAVGLVRVVEERRVRGATEKFYRAIAPNFSVGPDVLGALTPAAAEARIVSVLRRHADVVLGELGPALARSPAPITSYQRLRLPPGAGEKLSAKLLEWLEECRLGEQDGGDADDAEEWLLFAAFFSRAEAQ